MVETPAAGLADRLGHLLRHEWTLASLGGLLLAAVMTWPTLRSPTRTLPQDLGDPTLQAWQLAWSGHALTRDPGNLWHSNSFYPERYSFAFSDTLLGYAPAGAIGTGLQAALLRYNVLYVLVFAFAFVGAYALVRQLGATPAGAAVAGAAFAYAPWRLGQAGHLHVISTGGIALALAMLARGHGWSLRPGGSDGRPATPQSGGGSDGRPATPQSGGGAGRVRPGWALAGWLVAAWQIMLGFGIGLPFAYVLALVAVVAVAGWLLRRRPRLPRRLLLTDLGGGAAFAAVGAFMAYPYLQVAKVFPYAKRSPEDLALYSPPLRGFLTAPPESLIWGVTHTDARGALSWAPEMAMLPGFALIGLATAGLVFSVWTQRQRLLLGVGVVASLLLAMGTQAPAEGRFTYLLLYRALPGFDAIRTPGRLVLWTTLLMGVLAAGAVSAFAERGRLPTGEHRRQALMRLAALVPVALVLAEGLHATPHPVVPPPPAVLATVEGPMIVLPSTQEVDEMVMLWTTDRFPAMVNGGSGFTPERQREFRELCQHFPDPVSVEALRRIGVKTVVVLREPPPGWGAQPPQGAFEEPPEGLGVTRRDAGTAIVYALN